MAELDPAAELATAAVNEAVSVARNHVVWMWGGWFVGAVMGSGGGWLFARRQLETKYEKIAETEIDEMREHFRKRAVVRETKPDLSDLSKRVTDLGYQGKEESSISSPAPSSLAPPGAPNVQPPEEVRNVFESMGKSVDGWDWETEKSLREFVKVYVLHKDEFGEDGNLETTLTYYEGDDVLCDDHDRPVDDQHKLVGNCLEQFGHGSGDRNVVYVRNEELGLDLEVVKTHKSYAEEVHGLKHEDPPRRRTRRYTE
jgi:hypothetical protein